MRSRGRLEERAGPRARRGASASTRCGTTRRSPRKSRPARRAHRLLRAAARPRPCRSAPSSLTTRAGRIRGSRDDDLRLAETFATRAAVAVDLSERVAPRSAAARRRRPGARAPPAGARAPRRDRPGSHVHPSRPEGGRGRGRRARRAQAVIAVRELVVATLQDVRRLAVELRPKALDDFGLVPALERLDETVRRADGDRRQLRDARSARNACRRGGDRPLPHRSGGAHERCQARRARST